MFGPAFPHMSLASLEELPLVEAMTIQSGHERVILPLGVGGEDGSVVLVLFPLGELGGGPLVGFALVAVSELLVKALLRVGEADGLVTGIAEEMT